MHLVKTVLFSLVLLATGPLAAQSGETLLLRYPDIHGNTVAFVYAGDIWVADSSGGTARRLTSHEGLELFPKFSPDGRRIAFVGDYSGTRQVHVIDVNGGEPKQLTYYNDVGPLPPRGGIDNRVLDWTRDGQNVLFLPHRLPWGDRMGVPYVVPAAGGMETQLAIPEAGGGMFSPDGTKIVYTPIEREFRTWKRYRGGRAQDVWIYDLVNNTSEQITTDPATDNQPVWVDNTIYFASDRDADKLLNLYAYDVATKQTRKVTNHTDYDVLWVSAGPDSVVYEAGGALYRFDPSSGSTTRIPIRVYGDFKGTVPYFHNVRDDIQTAALSPTGVRALFGARGEVFTAPAKEGEIRNLTQTPGVREMNPTWSPDGRTVAYLSDRTGEYEIWVRNADGTGVERRVTTNGSVWRFQPVWSPDSRMLAFADKNSELHYVDVASGRVTRVDRGEYNDITYYTWSPDSQWIAYTKPGETRLSAIWVHRIGGQSQQLTSGLTDDSQPVFDPKGRYLYFLSDRDYNLTFSGFEFNYVYTTPTRIYVGLLAENGPALFLPTSDEEKAKAQEAPTPTPTPTPSPKPAETRPVTRIDVAGFEQRVRAIPGAPGDYRALTGVKNGVLYLTGSGPATALRLYDIDNKKEETILEGIQSYSVSSDKEKILFRKGPAYGIAAVKPGQKTTEGLIALDDLEVKIEPRAEWAQQFNDGWRILRDFFYDPNMHGVDWNAMKVKYGALVPHLAHRSDLDFILGELGGELNAGHVYVSTSDDWAVPRKDGGLLGAEIVADPSGYYRISNIFPGENWHEDFRSPLTEPGVRVREGDFILAVDGVSTRGVENFYRLLENKADRDVTLLVNSRADLSGARTETVRPVKQEGNLRYLEWVQSRREYVREKSGGRIGYIHLPNTGTEGNRELFKGFYAQMTKDALIIDDRYNGGGFIPDRMIELLDRPVLSYWARRNVAPNRTPAFAHVGPKAVLMNGYSSSGGDAFPYYFRKRGLGPLIGTRTWGGLIGITGGPSFSDGGSITAPSFRFFDEGVWEVENVGVSPDIEVIDRPELIARGIDPSLDKAIEVLLAELAKNPPAELVIPTPPTGR